MDEIKISNEKHYEKKKNYMDLLFSFHPLVCQLDEKYGLGNQ
jgi:NADH dehydrogenase/NADH:ubiquinone oxidoreductase subunit G